MGLRGDLGAIVGRDRELAATRRLVDAAQAGAACLVFEGEAGIGKTRLWLEAVNHARSRDFRVLSTRPSGADVRLAFAGLADLLRTTGKETWDSLPAPQRRALSMALLVEDAEAGGPDFRAVAAALLTTLRLLAEDRPVLVAVDDLQWLDSPTAQLLEFMLRRIDAERVGTLITVRTGDVVSSGGAGASAGVLHAVDEGRVEHIEVGPLSMGGAHELLREHLGLLLSRPALVHLHEASGGNPFYALQLGKALQRSGRPPAAGEPLPIPRDLRDLLRATLAQLTTRARTTLLAAAALAEPNLTVLNGVVGDPQAVAEDIDEAERAGIVEVTGEAVRFAHPLLASVHYGAAPAGERRALHRRLACEVGSREESARHLALAASGPDADVAATLEHASVEAGNRGATLAAAQLLEHAAVLTPVHDHAAAHRRRLQAAEAYFTSGGTTRSRELLEAALDDAAPGSERAEVLYRLGATIRAVDGGRSITLLQQAAQEASNDVLRAKIFCELSHWVYAHHAGFDSLESSARTAVELAERSGDVATLAAALGQLGGTLFMRGADVPVELMERAVGLEEQSGVVRVDENAGPSIDYAGMLLYAGEFAVARELLERLCRHARETDDAGISHPLHLLAYTEFFVGRWDVAEAVAREALEVAVHSGRESEEVGARSALGLVLGGCGRIDEARVELEAGLIAAQRSGRGGRAPRAALGLLELSIGDADAAWRWLEPAVALIIPLRITVLRPEVAFAIDALLELGRLDDAQALLDVFEAEADRIGRRWAFTLATRCRGLVLAAQGLLSEAEESMTRAVELAEQAGVPLELGRALHALGSVQRALHHKQKARATLGRAIRCFEALGAPVWAGRARHELGRIGGRVADERELSAVEQDIAALVAAGRSNKEVARELHLSVKTVEWNLTKIFRKLDVRSRTELAAALASHR